MTEGTEWVLSQVTVHPTWQRIVVREIRRRHWHDLLGWFKRNSIVERTFCSVGDGIWIEDPSGERPDLFSELTLDQWAKSARK